MIGVSVLEPLARSSRTKSASALHVGPNLRPLEKALVPYGQSVEGEISPIGDEDTFVFQAQYK